jgi:ribosomal-protein-alanine N-acetyltransferase
LRSFSLTDVEAVFAYAADPEITRYVEWDPHRNRRDSALYIRRCMEEHDGLRTFAVELCDIGRVIGAIDLRLVSRIWRVGEIGYTIARPYWGQGLNVEASRLAINYGFLVLAMRRIQAICDVANRRSYRTMEKLGMIRDMILYRARFEHGRPIDRYRYSIRRREWERHSLYWSTDNGAAAEASPQG